MRRWLHHELNCTAPIKHFLALEGVTFEGAFDYFFNNIEILRKEFLLDLDENRHMKA